MCHSSTSSTDSSIITRGSTFTAPSAWDRTRRKAFGVVWVAFHLKAGELAPEFTEPTYLTGQAAVHSQSASTWSWRQITARGVSSSSSSSC